MPVLLLESLSNVLGLFWLLLPVAAASGWWLARRSQRRETSHPSRADYFRGLNYLLDDKPDQALEVFAQMAELDRGTVETQLMLGHLFRRRGEVDRAIHIHHSLTTRGHLTTLQRQRVILELAEDYMRAGLFDRAEALYRGLIEQPVQGKYNAVALNRIIKIYEQEKDWRQAITHCDLLERLTGQVRKVEAAHYCCELALEALHQEHPEQAAEHLREALRRDANCARASLIQARLAMSQDDHEAAIEALLAVERQNPLYLSEVLEPLAQCYTVLQQPDVFSSWLHAAHRRHRYGWLTASLASHLTRTEGTPIALDFLTRELQHQPTFIGLRTLVELKLAQAETGQAGLETLYQASRQLLDSAVRYRCDHCGFSLKTLNWQCPSCKNWETITPLPDLCCRNKP